MQQIEHPDDRISELDAVAKDRGWVPAPPPVAEAGSKCTVETPLQGIADIIRGAAELRGIVIEPARRTPTAAAAASPRSTCRATRR
jgi:hypothetical protein